MEPKYACWDVMVDLETAATCRNAVVLSGAAVKFRIDDGVVTIGDRFLWVPDLRLQVAQGREVNPQTMRWWAAQETSAQLHWAAPSPNTQFTVPQMLGNLAEVCVESGVKDGQRSIWAHGVCFDIGILEDLYTRNHIDVPWKYNAVRDVRTLVRALPRHSTQHMTQDVMEIEHLIPHDPVSDCIIQIYNLAEVLPEGMRK